MKKQKNSMKKVEHQADASVGLKLISSVVHNSTLDEYHRLNIDTETLKPLEAGYWDYIANFVRKHGTIPKAETLADDMDAFILPKANEPASYYENQIRERYVVDQISITFQEAKKYLIKGEIDTVRALEIITRTVVGINAKVNRSRFMDFREAAKIVTQEYKKQQHGHYASAMLMGYPYLDDMSGGVWGGDVISIAGRPAMGKTFNMLFTGHNIWWHQKRPGFFVSMEMNTLAIGQRLSAMHTHKNLTDVKKAQLPTPYYNDFVKGLTALEGFEVPFWIVDGNLTATVEDIWSLARQLKPEFIVIDGAYLLKHPNKRLNRWDRVAENTELIKAALATDLDVPVFCSWQLNREATKKAKKGQETGLEDIGYSDAIGQISSIVLALDEEDSVETINKRKISVKKGRNGEVGNFYINWDFHNMNFSEIPREQKEESDEYKSNSPDPMKKDLKFL